MLWIVIKKVGFFGWKNGFLDEKIRLFSYFYWFL